MGMNDRERKPIFISERHRGIGLPTTACEVREMTDEEREYYSQFNGQAKGREHNAYQQQLNLRFALGNVRKPKRPR